MDPNQQPLQQPPQPAPPPTAPQPTPAPLQQSVPMQPQPLMPTMANTTKKSKKGLLVGAVIAVVLLLIGSASAWFLYFCPQAQSKRASTAYMQAATTGDLNKLYALGGATDDSTKEFLKKSSDGSRGSFKLSKSAFQGGKGYYLYNLTNDTNKHARTIVEKVDGKWGVTSYVYGANDLALMPGSSPTSSQAATTTQASQPAATPAPTPAPVVSQKACLQDADVATISGGQAYGTDFDGYRNYIVDTYFFNPDATSFTYPEQADRALVKTAGFYSKYKHKQFTIHLAGKVFEGTTTASGTTLANQRSRAIQAALVVKGVPASSIVIDPPQKSSATYADGSERNADLTIQVKLPCSQ